MIEVFSDTLASTILSILTTMHYPVAVERGVERIHGEEPARRELPLHPSHGLGRLQQQVDGRWRRRWQEGHKPGRETFKLVQSHALF